MLIRCRDCNSTVKPGEKKCYACGSAVIVDDGRVPLAKRFAAFMKLAFIASAALTVASLFFEFTPSFVKCLAGTVVLLFVKNSADQLEKRGG
jgi:hypothetical protein